jgi:hypothetical protein
VLHQAKPATCKNRPLRGPITPMAHLNLASPQMGREDLLLVQYQGPPR